jgi:fatty acid desaturase
LEHELQGATPDVALLRYSADRRSIAFAAVHFGCVGGAFILKPHGWAAAAAVALIAYSSFMQLISGHNAMHAPMFHARWLNRLWQVTLSLAFCYPVSAFVPVHNLSHHMHLQTPKDVLRTTEVRHRSNLLNLLHHVVQAAVHIHLLNAVYLARVRKQRRAWFAQVRGEILAVALAGTALAVMSPWSFLAFVLLPALIGQSMIFGLGYLQHDGCDAASAHNHSRNFTGRLFNWLIFDNGYHTVHHVQAGLHWSLARAAHAERVAPHIAPALDQRSILAYMWRTFVRPGKRLSYDGAPVPLPEARSRRELWTPASASEAGAATGAVDG